MPAQDHPANAAEADEPPPILGSWRNIYAVVFIWLAVLIFIFWMFTRYFS